MQITHDLAIGGLQQVVVNLCKTIDRNLFDIEVLCLRGLGEFAAEIKSLGIPVTLLPQKERGTDYFSFLKVARILNEKRIEVIHTHNTQPFIDGAIGGLLAGVKTMIHTDHARNFPDKRRYMFAEWLVSHWVYRVVGVSNHTSKNLIKYERISPKKIVTIINGIVGERYRRYIDRETKRDELGIAGSGPIIGLGARLTKQKGLTYLLQAMVAVIAAHPQANLVIAGDGPCREDLQRETEGLGIGQRVRFVGPRTDMPELIQLFDVYALPSLWEGLPIVLLEAMAAGCPIVATDVGGNSVAVKDGYNGYLVPARDPGALSEALIRLLAEAGLRRQLGKNGQTLFEKEFSAKEMTRKYEALYLRQV